MLFLSITIIYNNTQEKEKKRKTHGSKYIHEIERSTTPTRKGLIRYKNEKEGKKKPVFFLARLAPLSLSIERTDTSAPPPHHQPVPTHANVNRDEISKKISRQNSSSSPNPPQIQTPRFPRHFSTRGRSPQISLPPAAADWHAATEILRFVSADLVRGLVVALGARVWRN